MQTFKRGFGKTFIKMIDFSEYKILVVGDVMLDHYLFGEINRLSPEAPVPVVDIESEETRLGGAANVALNLIGLGAKTTLLSIVGEDKDGDKFYDLLKENGLKTTHIYFSKSRKTTVKTRIFDDDRQVARFDREDDSDLNKEDEEKILADIDATVRREKFHGIIIQDYNKGLLTKKVIKHLLLITTKLNIPIIVDPKADNFFEYQQIDLFKPNLKELSEALKHKIDAKNSNSLKRAAEELKKKNRFDNLLLTLGAQGIFVYTQSGESFIVPAKQIKTADVSGAGDTVLSIAALCFVAKMPFKKIAQLANTAAGKVCKKVGVVPITLKDIAK